MPLLQYCHGVEVRPSRGAGYPYIGGYREAEHGCKWRELTAASKTWHGGATKPTLLLHEGIRSLRIVVGKKGPAELRFGAIHTEKCTAAMDLTGTAGRSWYSDACSEDDTAVCLCCCYKQRGR